MFSSTALATLASKMSALDDAVPEATDAAFLVGFFLSFRGRIVSVLGLAFKLPLTAWIAEFNPNARRGPELTSSSSTMMCFDMSLGGALPPNRRAELDCLVCNSGEGAAALDLLVLIFTLPLSLPLSLLLPDWFLSVLLTASSGLNMRPCPSAMLA